MEILLFGLGVAVLGMGIVFVGLIILILFINLLRVIINAFEKKDKQTNVAEVALTPELIQSPEPEQADNAQLVAVITAALAVMLDKPANELRVRSLRRSGNQPAWNREGRRGLLESD